MDESYTFRGFAPCDLPRLHEVREAAFEPVFSSFRKVVGRQVAERALCHLEDERAEVLNRITKEDSSDELFVVEAGGKVVGFCTLTLDKQTKVGEIGLNAVDPEFQGRGIGTMREAGMRAASVGTGADESHAPARRAYEKAGFGAALPTFWMYRTL